MKIELQQHGNEPDELLRPQGTRLGEIAGNLDGRSFFLVRQGQIMENATTETLLEDGDRVMVMANKQLGLLLSLLAGDMRTVRVRIA